MTTSTLSSPITDSDFATPSTQAPSTIARQAIVNVRKEVVGYELFDRSQVQKDHSSATDAEMLFNVLSLVDADGQLTQKNFAYQLHPRLLGRWAPRADSPQPRGA